MVCASFCSRQENKMVLKADTSSGGGGEVSIFGLYFFGRLLFGSFLSLGEREGKGKGREEGDMAGVVKVCLVR